MIRIACLLVLVLGTARSEAAAVNATINNPTSATNDTRIVGGTIVTDRSQFAYQVSLRYTALDFAFCGGILLDDSNILTAAHCVFLDGVLVAPSVITAVVGDLQTNVASTTTVTREIKHIFVHEEYTEHTDGFVVNDVAVLRVESFGTLNSYVNNITMATTTPTAGTNCIVSGWGTTYFQGPTSNDLLYATVPVVSQALCNSIYGVVYQGMMCAGDILNGGVGVCQGDSGGPLVCNGNVAGVVSWGYGCAVPGYPAVYTDVAYYRSWINTQRTRSNANIFSTNVYLIIPGLIIFIMKL